MNIILFNVKYSANLGDGLLTECLEAELRRASPRLTVSSLDLAGRSSYAAGGRFRSAALMVLQMLPTFARRLTAGMLVERKVAELRRAWAEALRGADAVVIGGGNLFADADLNFPIKIHGALAEAAARGLPVGVYGVGVTDNWSQRGRQLFRDGVANADVVYAAVRDARSQSIWQNQFDGLALPQPALCRDPGLLAAKHFPRLPKRAPGRHIGICVTNPVALRYHAAPHLVFNNIDAWFLELSRAMAAKGWTVTLFSNGSPEDVAYLARVEARLANGKGGIDVAPHFATPAELAGFVSTCDVLVAHRMHACIAAYSYGIPHIGLAWDVKLDSFFESTGRSAYMVDPMALPTADAAALAERAFEEGIATRQHAIVLDECSRDVARLLDGLRSATAERPGQAQAS